MLLKNALLKDYKYLKTSLKRCIWQKLIDIKQSNNSGDSNTYPTELVLDLETSIKVVKTYVESGRLDDCIKWIQY